MPSIKLRNDPVLEEGRRPMGRKPDKARIRELNDAFRTTFTGGRVMMTHTVNEMEPEARAKLIAAVQGFDRFDKGNDPHGEHDFGSIEIDGEKFFFKIEYFDLAMSQHSIDAANPEATIRVLTIMRADEY